MHARNDVRVHTNARFKTRHGAFNGKLNGPFNAACFLLSEIKNILKWSTCHYCGHCVHNRMKFVAPVLACREQ